MKILYLITKSEAGGAQTHIWQLATRLIKKGNSVAVMSYPGGWLQEAVAEIGVIFYPNYFFSNSLDPLKILSAIKTVKKAVAEFQPDLVSCHSSAAGFLGRLAVCNKTPTIFTAHGWAFTEGVSELKRWLSLGAEKIAARYCGKIICVSNYDRNLALRYRLAPGEKISAIHNGVELQPEVEERNLTLPLRVVFVGRMVKQKDHLSFCRAFSLLSPDLQQRVQVFFIGDGSKRPEIERFIRDNGLGASIELLGDLRREAVLEELKQAHLFVLISNWEGFPRSILEAMSCGLPVLATAVGGVSEAVDENCGILVKRGDVKAIKAALEELINNPFLIKKLGQNAKQKVEREFSLEKMIKETEQVYQEIIRHSRMPF